MNIKLMVMLLLVCQGKRALLIWDAKQEDKQTKQDKVKAQCGPMVLNAKRTIKTTNNNNT